MPGPPLLSLSKGRRDPGIHGLFSGRKTWIAGSSPAMTKKEGRFNVIEFSSSNGCALLLEQNDEWAVQRARYMSLETIAPLRDDPIVRLPPVAAA
jgi:hypothetical protein